MGLTTILVFSGLVWMSVSGALLGKGKSLVMSIGGGFISACLILIFLAYVFDTDKPDGSAAAAIVKHVPAQIPKRKFAIDLTENQKEDPSLIKALESMVTACPGLQEYSADFSRARVENNAGYYFYNENAGMQVMFKILDKPKLLPAPLNVRSAGHTCFFDINGVGTMVSVPKEECQSICQGKLIESSSNLLLELK